MTVYPTNGFTLLDDVTAIERVRSAVDSGDPFSLVRLGDGEGVVLSFDDATWLQDLSYLQGHWGADRVRLADVARIRADMEIALRGADIVGVRPDIVNVAAPVDLHTRDSSRIASFVRSNFPLREEERMNLSERGARRLALLHRAMSQFDWPRGQLYCSQWIHWELLAGGALDELLEDVEEVGLVTSKPGLAELLAERFQLRVSKVMVPDKFIDTRATGAHVPDRYVEIRSELAFAEGTLVLVGAGIPAKAYCHWIKESGGIAIDIGSVMDAWVGRPSRPRVLASRFNVSDGGHVPMELQLSKGNTTDDRKLVPRWKPSRTLGQEQE